MHSNLTILEMKERKLERKKLRERERERKKDEYRCSAVNTASEDI